MLLFLLSRDVSSLDSFASRDGHFTIGFTPLNRTLEITYSSGSGAKHHVYVPHQDQSQRSTRSVDVFPNSTKHFIEGPLERVQVLQHFARV